MTVLGGKTIVLREEFAKELGVPAVGPQIKFQFKDDYPADELELRPSSGLE